MNESQIFAGALQLLDAGARAAYLDQTCAGNTQMRAAVESLLHAHASDPDFLEHQDASGEKTEAYSANAGAGDDSAPPSTSKEQTGEVLAGRYKLLEEIGGGGMGSVWMAQQQAPVKRLVAVKLIKAGMDSQAVLARFEAERQALALMDHPNIAKVFDAGTVGLSETARSEGSLARASGTGRPFFVMELVKGVPITKYCDAHHLTPRQRLELFVPVCHAIQHAHQKGIIHRDIKPSNVLVALYDDRPVPKVIDFGVAKATGQQLTEQSLHTGFGQVVGTLEYMSPEQATFNQLDVDTRSDIYSLGVLLYELLAGSPPFTCKDLEKAGVLEMLRVIREQEPSKPSTKLSTAEGLPTLAANRSTEPKRLTALVRGELDWIVMKALEKDRARRYETANGLAMDLQRYLADEPVLAGPPSTSYRLRKFVQRHKGPVVAAILVVLALLGGMMGTSYGLVQAEQRRGEAEHARDAEAKERVRAEHAEANAKRERDAAVAQKRRANEQKAIAQAVVNFLQNDLLYQANPAKQGDRLQRLGMGAEARENPTIKELLDWTATELVPEKIETKFPQQPLVQAEILRTVGVAYLGIGQFDKAMVYLARSSELYSKTAGTDALQTLRAFHDLALAYRDAGKTAEAIARFEQIRDVFLTKFGPDHPETLTTLDNLAGAYEDAGRITEAIALFEQVRSAQLATLGPDHPSTLLTLNNLALAYRRNGRIAEAIPLFEQARDAQVVKLGAGHPHTLTTLNNLAVAYRRVGRIAEAIALHEKIRDAKVTRLGPDHPDTLTTLNNLAAAYRDAGRTTEAIALFERVRDAPVTRRYPDHPDTLITLNGLAVAYFDVGRTAEAIVLWEQVRAARVRMLGPNHPATLLIQNNLAAAYLSTGKLTEAIALFEKVHDAQRKKFGPDHLNTLDTLANLAVAYRDAGRAPEAIALFEQVRSALVKKVGRDHPETLNTSAHLALTYLQQKKFVEAETILREYLAIMKTKEPDEWRTFNAKSMLGGALLGQKKHTEAEPLLMQGFEGMKQREAKIPAQAKVRLTEALERLVTFYDAVGKKDEAAKWQKELDTRKKKPSGIKGQAPVKKP